MIEPAVATRRERLRAETTEEIKARAWQLMGVSGTDALSLREVARQMGMAPSALYRYFASRNDLLTALIVDAFDSLADAITEEYERRTQTGIDAVEVMVAVCHVYRGWSLAHRTQWALVFSTPIPDYNGTEQTTSAAKRSTMLLIRIMADAVEQGLIDVSRLDGVLDSSMRRPLEQWSQHGGFALPAGALAGALWCYATLHGAIALEIHEHLPNTMLDNPMLFETAVRAMLAHISY